jgi:hypothetical protein
MLQGMKNSSNFIPLRIPDSGNTKTAQTNKITIGKSKPGNKHHEIRRHHSTKPR